MTNRHTGLNSYILFLSTGEYIYDIATGSRGTDHRQAQVVLWEPEKLAEHCAEAGKRLKWSGAIQALRAGS